MTSTQDSHAAPLAVGGRGYFPAQAQDCQLRAWEGPLTHRLCVRGQVWSLMGNLRWEPARWGQDPEGRRGPGNAAGLDPGAGAEVLE